jgi:FkbM family methyltransferase
MWLEQASRRVHAFESLGRHAALSRHNVTDSNVTLHKIAVGAEAGFCEALSVRECSGDAFIKPGIGTTEFHAMDSFVFTEVGFIKIAIEGFERQVVEGAQGTLLINHSIICVE